MPRYTDAQLEDALRKCKGMVYVAAKTLGCSGNTIKARLEKSEKLREVVIEESEIILDTAEIKLAGAIMDGDLGAIKYILSTKGKSRGYVERNEVTGANGANFPGIVVYLPSNNRDGDSASETNNKAE